MAHGLWQVSSLTHSLWWDTKESGETEGVGALADVETAEKNPRDVPVLGIVAEMERAWEER